MSMDPEVIFDPPQAVFPQQRDARRRMSHLKNLMMVRSGSFSTELGCPCDVRLTADSDRIADIPWGANSRHDRTGRRVKARSGGRCIQWSVRRLEQNYLTLCELHYTR